MYEGASAWSSRNTIYIFVSGYCMALVLDLDAILDFNCLVLMEI